MYAHDNIQPRHPMTLRTTLVLTVTLGCLHATAVRAQNYSIDWFTIDGGGGTSSGGAYSLSGTIGQPDAGILSGGAYSLTGGFWGIIQAIQTPGAPLLSVETLPNGNVRVFWPASATGFVLDQATGLAVSPSPTVWTPVGLAYQTNASQVSIITAPSPSQRYFRLRKP
jgi:hypothetical protein